MKDPAFLFYYRDFKSSTEHMTNEQRGAYIQLMCVQAENGFITDEDMKKICSNICFETMSIKFDKNLYEVVKSKFKEQPDAPGRFINNRLAEEIEKRAKYSESRRKNRKQIISKTYDKTCEQSYEKHMVNVNENRNINRNRKGGVGEKNQNDDQVPDVGKTIELPEIFTAAELLATDEFFLEQLAMKQHIDSEKLTHMLTQFDLSRQEAGEQYQESDLKKLKAGFQKWVNSWMYTERKSKSHAHNGHNHNDDFKITKEMYD